MSALIFQSSWCSNTSLLPWGLDLLPAWAASCWEFCKQVGNHNHTEFHVLIMPAGHCIVPSVACHCPDQLWISLRGAHALAPPFCFGCARTRSSRLLCFWWDKLVSSARFLHWLIKNLIVNKSCLRECDAQPTPELCFSNTAAWILCK